MNTNDLPTSAPTALDPGDLLRVLRRRKWFLLLPWLTALAEGVAAAVLLPPVPAFLLGCGVFAARRRAETTGVARERW